MVCLIFTHFSFWFSLLRRHRFTLKTRFLAMEKVKWQGRGRLSDCASNPAADAASSGACWWRVTWIRTWVILLGLNKEEEEEEDEGGGGGGGESFVKYCVGHVTEG
ncbi:hypothetical protein V6N13_108207 [Hibiscus sabdariffa]